MNIKQALEWSRANGGRVAFRAGYSGWIRWRDGWEYKLTFEELTADDWEPIGLDGRTTRTAEE